MESAVASRDYDRVARAIRFLNDRRQDRPGLDEVAAAVGLSPFHFQRLFRRWAGISPKRFLQVLTSEHAKSLLRGSAGVLDASLETGLSGPGRLHDMFVTLDAVTPGDYKSRGAGLAIEYGEAPTPFGAAFLAMTRHGVCGMEFVDEAGGAGAAEGRLAASWPGARLERSRTAARDAAARIFDRGRGRGPLPLFVRGTNFQVQVWRALINVPPGRAVAYGDLARAVGKPDAARAVGAAVGANPTAYLIPCHRVIRATGALGGYRWGPTRKQAILAWEGTWAVQAP